MNKGYLVISLDFELIWGLAGWTTTKIAPYYKNIDNAITALEKMIELFHKYDIKCTIGFVGAMNYNTLDELNTKLKIFKRPSYIKPIFYSFGSVLLNINKYYPHTFFFCKNIIENLKKNNNVELASHTFSHYYCLEDGQTIEDFKQDLLFVQDNSKENNINIKSIIFPRNQVSQEYLNICKQLGFSHYRGTLNNFLYKTNKTESRYSAKGALRFLDTYFNISGYNTFNLCNTSHNGIINVPGSRFLRPYSRKFSFLEYLKIRRIKKSMKYAAQNNQIYHLWWHPHNFGQNMTENLANLEAICKYYKQLNKEYNFKSSFISDIN